MLALLAKLEAEGQTCPVVRWFVILNHRDRLFSLVHFQKLGFDRSFYLEGPKPELFRDISGDEIYLQKSTPIFLGPDFNRIWLHNEILYLKIVTACQNT